MLRGEQGLAGRLHKSRFGPQRQRSLLMDAAARYDTHVSPARGETGQRSNRKQTGAAGEEWQSVKRKMTRLMQVLCGDSNGKRGSGNGSSPQVQTSASTAKSQYQLKVGEWSQPIMESFAHLPRRRQWGLPKPQNWYLGHLPSQRSLTPLYSSKSGQESTSPCPFQGKDEVWQCRPSVLILVVQQHKLASKLGGLCCDV